MGTSMQSSLSTTTGVRPRLIARAVLVQTMLLAAGCLDDPLTGPIGSLLLFIRPTAALAGSEFAHVRSITLHLARIDAVMDAGGTSHTVTLDSNPRVVVVPNEATDVLIDQVRAPVGTITQLRFDASSVVLTLDDGTTRELDPDTPALPSWRNTGWKWNPPVGTTFTIAHNEMTAIRALFDFNDRLVRQGDARWKAKPTVPAEQFDPNPVGGVGAGVFYDQLTVVFNRDTDPARVNEINTAIGARVMFPGDGTSWYRVKLPPTITLRDASSYYNARPEVVSAWPAVNFAMDTISRPEDSHVFGDEFVWNSAGFPGAWEAAQTGGRVGSNAVRVAVIDYAFDTAHPDLYQNIAINQGELPPQLFASDPHARTVTPAELAQFDCDPPGAPDGVISIRDLEAIRDGAGCPGATPDYPSLRRVIPGDFNANGRIDVRDMLYQVRPIGSDPTMTRTGWADNRDGSDANLLIDDIAGWDFATGGNDVAARLSDPTWSISNEGRMHGTAVAGVIGAVGDNQRGVAGVNWRVSIVPLGADPLTPCRGCGDLFQPRPRPIDAGYPDVNFGHALDYVEQMNVDPHSAIRVVSCSLGWLFVGEGAHRGCGEKGTVIHPAGVTVGVPHDLFVDGRQRMIEGYGEIYSLPIIPGRAHSLFVFSAGNLNWDIDQSDAFPVPSAALRGAFDSDRFRASALSDRVLTIGGTEIHPDTYATRIWYAPQSPSPTPGEEDVPPSGSNYSTRNDTYRTVDVYAPAVWGDVLVPESVDPSGMGQNASGTSLSQPIVAGSMALFLSIHPEFESRNIAALWARARSSVFTPPLATPCDPSSNVDNGFVGGRRAFDAHLFMTAPWP